MNRPIFNITKSKIKTELKYVLPLILYDMLAVNAAYMLGLLLRFDFRYSMIPPEHLYPYYHFIPIYSIFCLFVFTAFKLYRSLWRYAGMDEMHRIILASLITSAFHAAAITLVFYRMPISYYIGGAFFQFILISMIRFAYRFWIMTSRKGVYSKEEGDAIMVIGAGAAGHMIVKDVQRNASIFGTVRCIIDDDPNKWNRYLEGVPVVGGRDDILPMVDKYGIDKIYVAIPSADPVQRREILNICNETGCELKNIPGMYEIVNGVVTTSSLKSVDIEDLLGRKPIEVDMEEIYQSLAGKTILITGGGGSIGSEIVRQVSLHGVAAIIIFDIYENNAYDIQQEIKLRYSNVKLFVEIGSVRDSRRVYQVFEKYKPEIVFHAAAHKHVPLMEESPCEAIKNNTIGTYKTAYAAMKNGCQRFVLISTDKAVNPTNIMGASKRLCEMIVQAFDQKIKEGREEELPDIHIHTGDEFGCDAADGKDRPGLAGEEVLFRIDGGREDSPAERHKNNRNLTDSRKSMTDFVSVRFGNVLGSSGSVIPLFRKQIATTRIITVTHPDIIRYFMTIPEAVSLVLQAGAYARGGEIFVFDMGDPVKIDSLAKNLIRLSGLRPGIDVKIEYTGLRAGEKLYEEKMMAEEGLETTPNKLIHIGNPVPFDVDAFLQALYPLMQKAYDNDPDIQEEVKRLVPTYHPV